MKEEKLRRIIRDEIESYTRKGLKIGDHSIYLRPTYIDMNDGSLLNIGSITPTSFSEKEAVYIIRKNGSYYEAVNGTTGEIDYSSTGSDAVLSYAVSNLTSGRTWIETVIIKGNFPVTSECTVPSYTRLIFDKVIVTSTIVGAAFFIDNVSYVELRINLLDCDSKSTHGILLRDAFYVKVKAIVLDGDTNNVYLQDDCQWIDLDVVSMGLSTDYGIRMYVVNSTNGYIRDVHCKAQITGTDFYGLWIGHYDASYPLPDNIHLDVIIDNTQLIGCGISGKVTGRITCFNCPNQDGIEIFDGVFNLMLTSDYNGTTYGHDNIILGPDSGTQHIRGTFQIMSTRSGRRGIMIQNLAAYSCVEIHGVVYDNTNEGVELNNCSDVIVRVSAISNEYGVRETGTANYNVIIGCTLRDNTTSNLTVLGANTLYQTATDNDPLNIAP